MIDKIIFNTYQTIDEINTSEGIHTLVAYSSSTVPIFIPLVLFSFFIVSLLGSFYIQKRAKGYGDFPSSFAISGFITSILAILFSFIPNLISTGTIVVCVGITILGVIWLFFSRD